MTTTALRPRQLRIASRIVHLIGGAAITAVFYSPLIDNDAAVNVIRFAVLPSLTLSGVAIWFGPTWLARRRRAAASIAA